VKCLISCHAGPSVARSLIPSSHSPSCVRASSPSIPRRQEPVNGASARPRSTGSAIVPLLLHASTRHHGPRGRRGVSTSSPPSAGPARDARLCADDPIGLPLPRDDPERSRVGGAVDAPTGIWSAFPTRGDPAAPGDHSRIDVGATPCRTRGSAMRPPPSALPLGRRLPVAGHRPKPGVSCAPSRIEPGAYRPNI
jgi:hypothetical protein